MGLDDPAPSVDGSVPKPVRGVPSEMIVRNRIREASVRVFLILEDVMDGLVMERSVREMRPSGERVMRDIGRGRVSQSPFVAVNELRPIRKTIMRKEEPLLPTGTVIVDLEGVDANLGLEERGGSRAARKCEGVVTRTVVVHCRGSE